MSNEAPPPYPGPNEGYTDKSGFPQAQPYAPPGAYPPGPPGYQAVGAPPPNTVIITQPTTVLTQSYRETPVTTVCPSCRAQICTNTAHETGTFAWLLCVILFLVGCGCGCCLIPFCVDGAKDVVHSCPNCNHLIGRYNRL